MDYTEYDTRYAAYTVIVEPAPTTPDGGVGRSDPPGRAAESGLRVLLALWNEGVPPQ